MNPDGTMARRPDLEKFAAKHGLTMATVADLIAYRKNAKKDPSLGQGIELFSFLRKLTADVFFTSEIGINYLGYIGNTFVTEFPGCPPVPGEQS